MYRPATNYVVSHAIDRGVVRGISHYNQEFHHDQISFVIERVYLVLWTFDDYDFMEL